MTDTQSASPAARFSPELFAAFRTAPSMSFGLGILAANIVEYWPR